MSLRCRFGLSTRRCSSQSLIACPARLPRQTDRSRKNPRRRRQMDPVEPNLQTEAHPMLARTRRAGNTTRRLRNRRLLAAPDRKHDRVHKTVHFANGRLFETADAWAVAYDRWDVVRCFQSADTVRRGFVAAKDTKRCKSHEICVRNEIVRRF